MVVVPQRYYDISQYDSLQCLINTGWLAGCVLISSM